jgi:hypothetical protein
MERRHPLTPHLVVFSIEVWRPRTPFLVRHPWILDWLESIKTRNRLRYHLKDRYDKPERGSEWEPIKILLEGDRGSNMMNMASNTCLQLNYRSWSRPRSQWSATDPRNQQTTFQAKTHQHAQRKLAQLAACATPVRPMACAGQTGDTGQTGG